MIGRYPVTIPRNHGGIEELLAFEPDLVILSPHGDAMMVRRLFRAYAAWLETARDDGLEYDIPTVNQFLRAARGDGNTHYPWGDDPNHPELICEGLRYSESRPVSLLGRLGPRARAIVGLAGNLFELVRDSERGRLLRAGGCFVMPPNACTLDTMIDADWLSIDAVSSDGEINVPVRPERLTGFRIVRQIEK